MSGRVARWGVALASALLIGAAQARGVEAPRDEASASMRHALSADARDALERVLGSGDARGLPFAIVDKRAARIHLFAPSGRHVGTSVALLGSDPGDVAGRADRRTPAGRFRSEPGHNDRGEDNVWIDYDASLAIHRLRPAPAHQRRDERMASPDVSDKRVTLGCVVVPVAFYERVVRPLLGRSRGVVYVLPEDSSVAAMFGAGDRRGFD